MCDLERWEKRWHRRASTQKLPEENVEQRGVCQTHRGRQSDECDDHHDPGASESLSHPLSVPDFLGPRCRDPGQSRNVASQLLVERAERGNLFHAQGARSSVDPAKTDQYRFERLGLSVMPEPIPL